MKKALFATVLLAFSATLTAPVSARDDGPRFAQERLDQLVEQHAEASRHIAMGARTSPDRVPRETVTKREGS